MNQAKATDAAVRIQVIMNDLDVDERLEALYLVRLAIVREMGAKK